MYPMKPETTRTQRVIATVIMSLVILSNVALWILGMSEAPNDTQSLRWKIQPMIEFLKIINVPVVIAALLFVLVVVNWDALVSAALWISGCLPFAQKKSTIKGEVPNGEITDNNIFSVFVNNWSEATSLAKEMGCNIERIGSENKLFKIIGSKTKIDSVIRAWKNAQIPFYESGLYSSHPPWFRIPTELSGKAQNTAHSEGITLTFGKGSPGVFTIDSPDKNVSNLLRSFAKANIPVDMDEALLEQVKALREGISRVIDSARKRRKGFFYASSYGGVVTEEMVQSWHDRLNDIERQYGRKD